MAAGDSLGRQFFHGSNYEHQPGDQLKPGNEHDGRNSTVLSMLWTTTQPHFAANWGNHVYEVKHEGLVEPTNQGADPTPHLSLGATVVRKVPEEEIDASRKAGPRADQAAVEHLNRIRGV